MKKLFIYELSEFESYVFQSVENSIQLNKCNVIYLESGHFSTIFGVDEYSINSLNSTLKIANNIIHKYKDRVKIVLGILIDNLNSCTQTECGIENIIQDTKQQKLPNEINVILENYAIVKKDKIILSFERNLKNRFIKFIKKSSFLQLNSENTLLSPNTKEILLERKGNLFIVRCPCIIAQNYKDIYEKIFLRFNDLILSLLIVDFSHIMDIEKVKLGMNTYKYLFENESQKLHIINVFSNNEGDLFSLNFS